MAPRGDASDPPLEAELLQKPFLAIDQKARKGPADMSKSDECEIDLSRFLFHGLSVLPLW